MQEDKKTTRTLDPRLVPGGEGNRVVDTDPPLPASDTNLEGSDGGPLPEPEPDAVDDAVGRGVQAWFADHIRNSAVSQHTESWNLLNEKTRLLAGYIRKEMN